MCCHRWGQLGPRCLTVRGPGGESRPGLLRSPQPLGWPCRCSTPQCPRHPACAAARSLSLGPHQAPCADYHPPVGWLVTALPSSGAVTLSAAKLHWPPESRACVSVLPCPVKQKATFLQRTPQLLSCAGRSAMPHTALSTHAHSTAGPAAAHSLAGTPVCPLSPNGL